MNSVATIVCMYMILITPTFCSKMIIYHLVHKYAFCITENISSSDFSCNDSCKIYPELITQTQNISQTSGKSLGLWTSDCLVNVSVSLTATWLWLSVIISQEIMNTGKHTKKENQWKCIRWLFIVYTCRYTCTYI